MESVGGGGGGGGGGVSRECENGALDIKVFGL